MIFLHAPGVVEDDLDGCGRVGTNFSWLHFRLVGERNPESPRSSKVNVELGYRTQYNQSTRRDRSRSACR